MQNHPKKGNEGSLIFAAIMLLILGLFTFAYYKENQMRSKIRQQISLLPPGFEKFCHPKLREEIHNLDQNVVTYKQMEELLTELQDFDSKHKLQIDCPAVYIYSQDDTGNDLKNYHGKKQMHVVIVDEQGYVFEDDEATVNIRGNSTSAGDKKPYNIKFSKKKQILDLGRSKKWSLFAECFDPTLIRNILFFDLAKAMGLEYTPDARFVRVYMDDIYKGCYLLTERADIAVDRVNIVPAKGEFIFEYEEDRKEDDTKYIVTANNWRFAIKDPDDPDDDFYSYMEEVLNLFDEAVTGNDYDQLTSVIDIDSFAKYYLLSELAKPIDFDYSSVKFYLKDGLIHAGPVWDYDISSGNYDPDFYSVAWYGETSEEKKRNNISYYDLYCNKNPVYGALLEYEEFRSLVRNYLAEYDVLIESLYADQGLIDQIIEENRDLFVSNYTPIDAGGAGWKVDHKYSGLEGNRLPTYEENVEYLKTWLRNRYEWLRDSDPWQ